MRQHHRYAKRRFDALRHAAQGCAVARELAADNAQDAALEAEEEGELGFALFNPANPGSPHPAELAGDAALRSAGSPRRRLGSPRRSAPAHTVSRFAFLPPRALRTPSPNPAINPTDSETCTASELGELGWGARPAAGARRSNPGHLGLELGPRAGHGAAARFYSFDGSVSVFGGGAFGSAAGESGLGSDSEGETDGATSGFEPMEIPGSSPSLVPGPSKPAAGPAWLWSAQYAPGGPDSERDGVASSFSTVRSAPIAGRSCGPAGSGLRNAAGPSPQGPAAQCPVQPECAGAPGASGSSSAALANAGFPAGLPLLHASSGAGPDLGAEGVDGAAPYDDGYQSSSEDSDEPRGGARGTRWAWLGRGSSAGSQPSSSQNPNPDHTIDPRAGSLPACGALVAEPACAAAQSGGGGDQGGTALGRKWLPSPSMWSAVRQRIARRRASQGGS